MVKKSEMTKNEFEMLLDQNDIRKDFATVLKLIDHSMNFIILKLDVLNKNPKLIKEYTRHYGAKELYKTLETLNHTSLQVRKITKVSLCLLTDLKKEGLCFF